jgi:hypothetical protein
MSNMHDYPLSIGGITFQEPVLEGAVFDAWDARIRLHVAECAPPYNWDNPRRVEVVFDGVIEIRAFRANPRFEREEIWEAGEEEATHVQDMDNENVRLTNTAFRRNLGFTWTATASRMPHLVSIASDGFYIEFLYGGNVTHRDLRSS